MFSSILVVLLIPITGPADFTVSARQHLIACAVQSPICAATEQAFLSGGERIEFTEFGESGLGGSTVWVSQHDWIRQPWGGRHLYRLLFHEMFHHAQLRVCPNAPDPWLHWQAAEFETVMADQMGDDAWAVIRWQAELHWEQQAQGHRWDWAGCAV